MVLKWNMFDYGCYFGLNCVFTFLLHHSNYLWCLFCTSSVVTSNKEGHHWRKAWMITPGDATEDNIFWDYWHRLTIVHYWSVSKCGPLRQFATFRPIAFRVVKEGRQMLKRVIDIQYVPWYETICLIFKNVVTWCAIVLLVLCATGLSIANKNILFIEFEVK